MVTMRSRRKRPELPARAPSIIGLQVIAELYSHSETPPFLPSQVQVAILGTLGLVVHVGGASVLTTVVSADIRVTSPNSNLLPW